MTNKGSVFRTEKPDIYEGEISICLNLKSPFDGKEVKKVLTCSSIQLLQSLFIGEQDNGYVDVEVINAIIHKMRETVKISNYVSHKENLFNSLGETATSLEWTPIISYGRHLILFDSKPYCLLSTGQTIGVIIIECLRLYIFIYWSHDKKDEIEVSVKYYNYWAKNVWYNQFDTLRDYCRQFHLLFISGPYQNMVIRSFKEDGKGNLWPSKNLLGNYVDYFNYRKNLTPGIVEVSPDICNFCKKLGHPNCREKKMIYKGILYPNCYECCSYPELEISRLIDLGYELPIILSIENVTI